MNSILAFLLLPYVLGGDIITELTNSDEINVLADLAEEAGLKDLLSSPGPITVFAPTNEAFRNLPPFITQKLFEDKEHLKKVILYHMVGSSLPYDDITDESAIATNEGTQLRLNKFQMEEGAPSFVTVNGKLVVHSLPASNGVIHIMSDLLYPLPMHNIAEILSLDPRFSSLREAVKLAGMEDTLTTGGPYTLFAPTNKAFTSNLDSEEAAKAVVQRHLVSGSYFAARLVNQTITADSGDTLVVTLEAGDRDFLRVHNEQTANKAVVTEPDVLVHNGVIHAINNIL